jgi:NAD(P)-dependent dehydrogenase (short-subunit alcohol dehydrogenase family)
MGALDGKVVLVTGGGNGIGKECALIAAREGAKVLVNDLGGGERGGDEGSAGPAEAVAEQIRASGGVAVSNSKSVTDMGAVKDMVAQAIDELGGLHAVINPAGILRDGMFHKMPDEDWDIVVAVHLRGSYNVCRAAIEHFRNQNEGSFVLFTSTSGLIGNIGQTNYAAAKLGIMGLSRVLAMEGASKNVRSNIIAPTAWTRLIATIPIKDEAGAARMQAMQAALRPDQPAKLAGAGLAGRQGRLRPDLRRALGDPGAVQPAAAGRKHHRARHLDGGEDPDRGAAEDGAEVHLAWRPGPAAATAAAPAGLTRTPTGAGPCDNAGLAAGARLA